MTKPNPRMNAQRTEQPIDGTLHGATEEWGPLVRQPAPAARLARILHRSAEDLWDSCTLTDSSQVWEEARAIASRILTSCPGD